MDPSPVLGGGPRARGAGTPAEREAAKLFFLGGAGATRDRRLLQFGSATDMMAVVSGTSRGRSHIPL